MTARARPGGLVIRTAGMAISHERREFATNCQQCQKLTNNPIAHGEAIFGSTNDIQMPGLIDIEARHAAFRVMTGSMRLRAAVAVLSAITEVMDPMMLPFAGTADSCGGIGHGFDKTE